MSTEPPPLTPEEYDELLPLVTVKRLGSYVRSTGGTTTDAFELYEWNMRAAASVMELTSMVEVITRNALDTQLRDWAQRKRVGASWLDTIPVDAQGLKDLRQARDRATRKGKRDEVHGRAVAELSLGFWRYLVESRYLTSLWIPSTHAAFPFGHPDLRTRQKDVAFRMQQLNYVRNRAAHHEPIHERNLSRDLQFALDLACWISPTAQKWITVTTSLPSLIAERPTRRAE